MNGDNDGNEGNERNERNEETGATEGSSRRDVLAAAGTVGFAAGAPGVVAGQETTEAETTTETETETTTREGATTIVLGGKVEYWLGLAPAAIEGRENPTLQLQSGERYRLIWINLDGVEHELIVEDADGNELVATESSEGVGETRSTTFEASEEMAEYYCEYHPESMRGGVELGEGFTATGTTTGTTDGTDEGTTTTASEGTTADETTTDEGNGEY